MGRQIAIKLSKKKEDEFVDFLKENNCVLVYPWSKNKKINILKNLPKTESCGRVFHIWKKDFVLKPEFVMIKKEYRKNEYKYGLNDVGKPLIEFVRSEDKMGGRIYWEKYFTTSNPEYNVIEFEKWYNEIIKWFRKNCVYKEGIYIG